MGICVCNEGKQCSVHFFRRHANPDKYVEDKKKFKSKKKEAKLKSPCECDNCDCTDHSICECEDCDCINCAC